MYSILGETAITRSIFNNSPMQYIFSIIGLIVIFVAVVSIFARKYPEKKKACIRTEGIGIIFIGAAGIILWMMVFSGVMNF